jgi:hypothetical protein
MSYEATAAGKRAGARNRARAEKKTDLGHAAFRTVSSLFFIAGAKGKEIGDFNALRTLSPYCCIGGFFAREKALIQDI